MTPDPLYTRAASLLAQGQTLAALPLLQRLVEQRPGYLDALLTLARHALAAGQLDTAISWFTQARLHHPAAAQVARALGVALAEAGRLDEAERELRAAWRLDPQQALAGLHLGWVLRRLGREAEGLKQCHAAIRTAQARGEWLGPDSTPLPLRARLVQTMAEVAQWRGRHIEALLAPHVDRYGRAALDRVLQAAQGWLQPGSVVPARPAQRPRFLFVPGLTDTPWLDPARIPFAAALEAAAPHIRAEALACWENDASGFQPFLEFGPNDPVHAYLGGHQPAWDALFFFRHGARFEAPLAACPHTARALESAPLIRIPGHAPEICYSVLRPGTHILPHTGVSNLRVVVHLPLVIPADCALNVAGEARAWREGEVCVFDDTFEHEAWNHSAQTRIILLMDAWHPDLDPAEQAALTDLVSGIGALRED